MKDAIRIIELLRKTPVGAVSECLRAIDAGTELVLLGNDQSVSPVSELRTIFERRIKHLKAIGRSAVGGDALVVALQEDFEGGLRMAVVDQATPPIHFQLFLTADLSRLIGCIGVDETGNENFGRFMVGSD